MTEHGDLPMNNGHNMTGWWCTYPSEKWWSSSVGMMKFPTEWKVIKFHGSKPPTRWWFIGKVPQKCLHFIFSGKIKILAKSHLNLESGTWAALKGVASKHWPHKLVIQIVPRRFWWIYVVDKCSPPDGFFLVWGVVHGEVCWNFGGFV